MRLEASRSVLLLIDLQERLVPAMFEPARVLDRCGVLLGAARRLAVPVLATRQYPQGLGPFVEPLAGRLDETECRDKLAFSAFGEESLSDVLRDFGRDQFVIAGVEAHVCVLQTALDLVGDGYGVAVVGDAVTSRRESSRDLAFDRLRSVGVSVVDTEMVVFEWLDRAGTDDFKALAPLLR